MIRPTMLAAIVALAALAACAGPRPPGFGVREVGTNPIIPVLTDSRGMSLYTYDRDPRGKSNCHGDCARNWPPALAAPDAQATGGWSIVTRDDGTRQWAYKGKPLYANVRDLRPGDITGNKFNGVWSAAVP